MENRRVANFGTRAAYAPLPWVAVLLLGWSAISLPAQVVGETNRVQKSSSHTKQGSDAVPLAHAMSGFLSFAATNISFNTMAPVNRAAKDPWDGENFVPGAITNLLWATETSNPSTTTAAGRVHVLQRKVMPGLAGGPTRRSDAN
jgi:hypothetical protein